MSISTLPTVDERLQARVAQVAAVLNRAHAQLVELTAELIETGAWAGEGILSPVHWLMLRAGLSRARAQQVVALAQRADELPATLGALGEGVISLDQATPIGRHVPAQFEASVLQLARHATVPQITRAASGTDFRPIPSYEEQQAAAAAGSDAAVPPDTPVAPPSLTMQHRMGRFHLHYQAPSDIGALVETAVREATDALWRRHNGRSPDAPTFDDERGHEARLDATPADTTRADARATDTAQPGGAEGASAAGGSPSPGASNRRSLPATGPAGGSASGPAGGAGTCVDSDPGTARVTLAEGFAEVAARALSGVQSKARREHYRIYVHLDTDGSWLTGQPRLPGHITDTLTCDGILQPLWQTEGAPVNVGRAQRIVPERTRRLLDDRDRGCRYPGCPARGFTEKHHIIHWLLGGTTDTPNLISLCPQHHDAHHRDEFDVHGNADLPDEHPDAAHFTTPTGRPITYRPPPPTPPEAPLPAGTPYRGPTGERMYARNVAFYPAIGTDPRSEAPDDCNSRPG